MESNAAGLSFLPVGLRKIANKRVEGKSRVRSLDVLQKMAKTGTSLPLHLVRRRTNH